MHIKFNKNGLTKEVKVGFSWTIFCFGVLALLIRKQYGLAAVSLFSFGLANFYFIFAANRMLARQLIEDGWTSTETMPAKWGIVQP